MVNVVLISSIGSRVRLLLMIATLKLAYVIRQKMKHVRRKLDMKNLLLFECMTFLLLYEFLSFKNEVSWHLFLR